MKRLPVRIGIQQRILPAYRVPFFDALADECERGACVFAGKASLQDGVIEGLPCIASHHPAQNAQIPGDPLRLMIQTNILEWLNEWQPDILIAEANPRVLSTASAIRWMHHRGRKVIGWGLGAPLGNGALKMIKDSLRSQFLMQFDAIVSYSQVGASQYRKAGFKADRIFIAPNAVTPRPAGKPIQREKMKPGEKPVILFVGRLQERKRLDMLFKACAALTKTTKPELWIVGDGPARATFESQARSYYPQARFWGARRGKDLDELYQKADLFVLPGTGGLAVQQALSFSLPVIVAQADGTQSDLVRPENGWLIPPGDQAALEAILKDAISNIPRLRKMGAASYRIVANEVNLETMLAGFKKAIECVLSKE